MGHISKDQCASIADMGDAVVGYMFRNGQLVLVYDFSKLVKLFIAKARMTFDEAIEHVEEEVEKMWMGEATPAVVRSASYDEIRKMFIDDRNSLN